MARKVLRAVEYICDQCGATVRVRQMRTVLPEGWMRVTVAWTIPGTLVEDTARRDLCPQCATVTNQLNLGQRDESRPRLRLPASGPRS